MPGKPGERAKDAYERAKAAAAPKIARAQAEAAPRAEKAAKKAGTLFGQLKEKATETAKGFKDGYQKDGADVPSEQPADRPSPTPPADRPKPGPGAG